MKEGGRALTVRTELLLTMVAVVVLATLVSGFVAYHNAAASLEQIATRTLQRQVAFNRELLLAMLEQKRQLLEGFLADATTFCTRYASQRENACLREQLATLAMRENVAGVRLHRNAHGIIDEGSVKSWPAPSHDAGERPAAFSVEEGNVRLLLETRLAGKQGTLWVSFEAADIHPLFFDDGNYVFASPEGFVISPSAYSAGAAADQSPPAFLDSCLQGTEGMGQALFGETGVYQAYLPLTEIGGGCLGSWIRQSEVLAPARRLRNRVALLTGALGFLMLPLALFTSRLVSRPLEGLRRRVQALREGDFEGEFPLDGPHELRDFSRTVEETARALQRSQEALRNSERHVRALLNSTFDAVIAVDTGGVIRAWNDRAEALFGWSADNVLGCRALDTLVPPESAAGYAATMRRLLDGQQTSKRRKLQALLRRADGAIFDAEFMITPIAGEHETLLYAFIDDVSERLQLEKERTRLLESERAVRRKAEREREQFFALLMQAPAAISIIRSRDLTYQLANPVYCGLFGESDLQGKKLDDAIPELTGQSTHAIIRHVLATRRALTGHEVPIRIRRSGKVEERYFNVMARPLHQAGDDPEFVLIFGVDVTEQVVARRRSEAFAEQMNNQQRWLESILDRLPIPLLLAEPGTGRRLFTNVAAEESRHLFEPDVKLRPAAHYVYYDQHDRPIEGHRLPYARAAKGDTLVGEQVQVESPWGRHVFLVHAQTLPGGFGHQSAMVLLYQNVTGLKQVEAELQQALRLRDDFLSVASHELRTPLTPLRLKLQTLDSMARTKPTLQLGSPEALRLVEQAERQSARMAKLLDVLLDVSRIRSGRLDLSPEPTSLLEVVTEVTQRFREEIKRAGCSLRLRIHRDARGMWDRFRIEQVVVNLLTNALKYGAGRPVRVSVAARSRHALLAVSDEGIGISRDDSRRIFERFERTDTARSFSGLGLGLFIVNEIVQAHGGRIRVRSAPGHGSTFVVLLPYESPRSLQASA